MFAKRLLQKVKPQKHGSITNMELQLVLHYGIPSTASILAFDPIQRLLAIGTLDGRIKIIGGDNIEGLLISPKKLPYKNLEFLHNQGFLLGVLNDNDIQVWNLECRRLSYSLQWEANITSFAVIHGTYLMYIGDENGLVSVLNYDFEEGKLLRLPYTLPAKAVIESVGVSCLNHGQIVGILPQPCSSGSRVLIAYENGLIILWDVSEGHVVTIRGYTELQLKGDGTANSVSEGNNELQDSAFDLPQEEKEICSLCWASSSGAILAVGYINGDILLWDVSSESILKGQQNGLSSKTVVKLQLASGNRRLPIIVLRWSPNDKSNDGGGQLLIYGGDDMGSEEVLTVLNLDWSSGLDSLRCISRVDLQLTGSFADVILIPNAGAVEHRSTAALFVLTNPGQISVYDGSILPILKAEEGKDSVRAEKFPVVVPTKDPCITVTKLCLLPMGKSPKDLLRKAYFKREATQPILPTGARWHLTGGVPNEPFCSEDKGVERIYISGYQDGSVRIWDSTCPILRLLFVLEGKVPGIEVDVHNASVSELDFCPINMTLAVGNERGLVRVYKLQGSSNESSYHIVSETRHEVHIMQHGEGFHCTATFIFSNSPIRTLKFTSQGEKLVVGFETGQVAMLDMVSLSIIFCTDYLSAARSAVISIATHGYSQISALVSSPKNPSTENPENSTGVLVIVTKDAHVIVVDNTTGKIISSQILHTKKDSAAISMYVIDESNGSSELSVEKCSHHMPDESSTQGNSPKNPKKDDHNESENTHVVEDQSCHVSQSDKLLSDPLLLLCCEDALLLCSLNSVIEGNVNIIQKANLVKHCCWSATFKKKEERTSGLILLYQTGDLEMRSLPDLEVLAESSLMSILRWSFKTNMEKTMSSYDNGQITLVNGCEIAFISLLACGNDFRIPESLPCLHDKVLAAAADAAISISVNQKKKQDTAPRILGIIKGLKGDRVESNTHFAKSRSKNLEDFFLKDPFITPLATTAGDAEVELSIDDIVIDDSLPITSTPSRVDKKSKTNEKKEREKLLKGASNDTKPRVRTAQEIVTQYRFKGDANLAAAAARDKLVERQEKLERISKNTEELQAEASNFAELATELARTMEKKKWWKI